MAGGVHGRERAWQGVCVAGGACMAGGVHGREHAWQGGRAWHAVNERAVRILL